MPKQRMTADELIWLFHEELADTDFPSVGIAIVPGNAGGWTALTSAGQRKRHPMLVSKVAQIEKRLQQLYSLRQD